MPELLNITLESGDLSEFNTVTTTGTATASADAVAAMASTSEGLLVALSAQGQVTANAQFTEVTEDDYRLRFYFNTTNVTLQNFWSLRLIRLFNSADDLNAVVDVANFSGTWNVTLQSQVNNTGYALSQVDFTNDGDKRLEIHIHKGNGDGYHKLYLDGVEIGSQTSLTNHTIQTPNRMLAGSGANANHSGNLYLDEFVFRNDATEIGAAGGGASPKGAYMFFFSE